MELSARIKVLQEFELIAECLKREIEKLKERQANEESEVYRDIIHANITTKETTLRIIEKTAQGI